MNSKLLGLVCLTIGALFLVTTGCDTEERISRLEKQTQELQAEVKKDRAATDYDLQAKCSRDARAWFKENWQSDKDTLLLDYTNHYNKSLNKCFVVVEYHFSTPVSEWTNDMTLWDVYENSKYGNVAESHSNSGKPDYKDEDVVGTCTLLDKTCKTVAEFSNLVRPHMSD